jgi:heme a synthase
MFRLGVALRPVARGALARRVPSFAIVPRMAVRNAASPAMAMAGGAVKVAAAPAAGTASKAVGYWLMGCGGMVASMIVIGGATRITRSGLAMVDWRPQGGLPPISAAEWEEEFAKYQDFPEYKRGTGAKNIEEFKPIYYLEWGHRMWGRLIGVVFAVPGLYFAARGRIPRHIQPRLIGLFGLGGLQGLVGWWMVKSGLDEALLEEHAHEFSTKETRVSPYRLAAHLGTAFVTYAGLVWTGLEMLEARAAPAVAGAAATLSREAVAHLGAVRRAGLVASSLVGVTVLSGAFVAGNDAGLAYNSWPEMGYDMQGENVYVPEGMMAMEPAWRNLFENTATVQFDHRNLAYATTAAVLTLAAVARRDPALWATLPQSSRTALYAALGMTGVQVSLGIGTLLSYVPEGLAIAHQGGSVALFTICLTLMQSLSSARRAQAGAALKHAGSIKAALKAAAV